MEQLIEFVQQYPWFTDLVMIMGSLRILFKPVFTIIEMVVDKTETTKDNEIWNQMKSSKSMIFVLWLIDYVASVKIKTLQNVTIPLNLDKK